MIILYIAFVYCKERIRYKQKNKISIFDMLIVLAIICVFFDGWTAYTVNNLDKISKIKNMVLHMFFLISLDSFIFLLFVYMLSITSGLPKSKIGKLIMYSPFLVNVIMVIINMPTLEYHKGEISNYSMGISAYTCFAMAAIYILLSLIIFFSRWKYIESNKRLSIFTYLLVLACITVYQMIHPQSLLSSICATIIILGIYSNQENPSVVELAHYHDEMIMGFATLVENKDGSTGGHIKRTTMYVKLLAEELRQRGYYKEVLTKDYMKNLSMAAPMHDIGKISIPDVILQKPGKLTDEEYQIMKQHSANGGKVIKETFGHLENNQYTEMAYQVARYHHEKWNGKGYPEGLEREEIPLCARIMAIADVFDALSQKRCYKEPIPLDKCFDIIRDGKGQDFDPMLVEVFMDIRDKVEEVYNNINNSAEG